MLRSSGDAMMMMVRLVMMVMMVPSEMVFGEMRVVGRV